jgi:hypothetical protein
MKNQAESTKKDDWFIMDEDASWYNIEDQADLKSTHMYDVFILDLFLIADKNKANYLTLG